MKQKLKIKNLIIFIIIILIMIFIAGIGTYYYMIGPVDNEKKSIEFMVESGDNFSNLGSKLESNKLIKSEFFYKIFIKISNPSGLQKGTYILNTSMDLKEIVNTLSKGTNANPDVVVLTIPEGKSIVDIAKYVADVTNNEKGELLEYWNSEDFIKKVIEKYWFVTKDVKNKNIRYSLEGYFFPSTYELQNKDVDAEYVAYKLLDQMAAILSNYRVEIEDNEYSVHELLTLASIVELEGKSESDRKNIASVFYNRLAKKWSLGSDVTTYYAENLKLWERDLTSTEINNCNGYNTRTSCMAGKLPVGPICNVSSTSIQVTVIPVDTDYYYFVSDKLGNIYFTKTLREHNSMVSKLKKEGKWYQY